MVSQEFVRRVGYLGAATNWLIPVAAVTNILYQPPENINIVMTGVLAMYSMAFMRWSLAITPANYPLCGMHCLNVMAQSTLGVKYGLGRKAPTKKD